MEILRKAAAPAPSLPMEVVDVPALGGAVVVRGLMLRQRIAILAGSNGKDYAHICELLAACVFDADDKPLYSVDEWEAFGATHFEAAASLFAVASRLVGADAEAVAKN